MSGVSLAVVVLLSCCLIGAVGWWLGASFGETEWGEGAAESDSATSVSNAASRRMADAAADGVSNAPAFEVASDEGGGSAGDAARVARLALRVSPPDAQVRIDGTLLDGPPFVAELRRDGARHRVEVTAPGYAPFAEFVTIGGDRELEVALRPRAKSGVSGRPRQPGLDRQPLDQANPYRR